jgi:glycosyltransferase involved in cell wall biosynthesis
MELMENNIPKFTFCITSKNNLRYLKYAIYYIKQNSFIEHNILVFIDADNDGTEKWCIENGIKFIKNQSKELFGIGNAYNLLVNKAETDFVVIYHADMIMGKGFDIALYNNWKPKTVISATRIEPPLHPADPAKIVLDLGLWPETDIKDGFKVDEFNTFVEQNKKDIITNGIFAPWLIHKDDFNNVGGHDPIMKSHSEDRDLFNRFLLNGCELIQSWEALVYHLTCRGGQFEHANETKDLIQKSDEWNKLAHNQTREFIRKWGNPPKYNEFQYPIITPKYNISFVVTPCDLQLLELLETWCDRIYIDDEMGVLLAAYYENEHKNTSYDLTKRILNTKYNDPKGENDIVVEFSAKNFTQQSFDMIQKLPEIIKESGEIGEFELDIFKITINSITEYQNDLIYLKNN